MKTLHYKRMVGLILLPLLGLPLVASSQAPETSTLEEVRQPAKPPVGRSLIYPPRIGSRAVPGIPDDQNRASTPEALRYLGDAHVLLQGTDWSSERRPGSRSPARATLPNAETSIGAGRWAALESSGYRYAAELPYARAAAVSAETSVALRGSTVGISRLGKVGSALAALFGLGAWSASRGRKEG